MVGCGDPQIFEPQEQLIIQICPVPTQWSNAQRDRFELLGPMITDILSNHPAKATAEVREEARDMWLMVGAEMQRLDLEALICRGELTEQRVQQLIDEGEIDDE